jgi:SAM-dependent methyltransferase
MDPEHVSHLACPLTKRPLLLEGASLTGGRVERGTLVETVSGARYPIVDFIPRFVPASNYSDSFGFEWKMHSRTQHDSYSGFAVSRRRFEAETKWAKDLHGEKVLEVGCGSGRFTEIALDTGAFVVSLDYSNAVAENYRWHRKQRNLLIVQADVYQMPFRAGSFDRAFCFGMLQHTPNPARAFLCVLDSLKPGGWMASDIYAKDLVHWLLHPRYWIHPFLRRLPPATLYKATRRYIDLMWPIARLIRRIPKVGCALNWRLLIADHSNNLPGAEDVLLKEWAYLDTFDMLSPAHDHPQTLRTFRRWHQDAGLTEIEVHYGFNGVEGRGRKRVVPEPQATELKVLTASQ